MCPPFHLFDPSVAVLVAANMDGSDKLPLLVIGGSKNPRCFKRATIPLDYEANSTAWMTGEIFENWLRRWDRRLRTAHRKVLLVLDNFSGHPKISGLDCITLLFLPPNTTSVTQPMDMGVIHNLKHYYRQHLLRRRLNSIDSQEPFKFSLLDAMHCLRRAWSEDVKVSTIAACFRKAGFAHENQVEENNGDEQVMILCLRLQFFYRVIVDRYGNA